MIRSLVLSLLLTGSPFIHAQCERTFAVPPHVSFPENVTAVASGLFDADARPDVAVAVEGGAVTVLTNSVTGYAYGPTTTLPATALRLFATDSNKDGRLDLVALGASYFATLLSNGNGTFTVTTTALTGDAASLFRLSAFADYNEDGRDDLAIAFGRNNGGVVRTFIAGADGSFSEPNPAVTLAKRARGIAVADLTNDAHADLAILDGTNALILPGKGNGTFAPAQNLVATPFFNVIAGDFDGDHRADLMIGSTTSQLLSSKNNYALSGTVNVPSGATVADLDGDGALDLLAGPLVYRGNGNATFTNVTAGAVMSGAAGHAFADFNGDGRLDVASGTSTKGVAFRYGLGGARLDGAGSSSVDPLDSARTLLVGDIDGNGRQDLVVHTDSGIESFVTSADGTLTHRSSQFIQPLAASAVIGDFNKDGKLDVFIGSAGVAFGTGDGVFGAPAAPLPAALLESTLATGDFNADGNLDVVSGSDQHPYLTRLLGDGSGHFTSETTNTGSQSVAVAAADFNRDGRDDIAVLTFSNTVPSTGPASLYLIDGANPSVAVKIAEGLERYGLAAGDIDGDGNADLAAFSASANELLIFGGNGNGTFRVPAHVAILPPVDAGMPNHVTLSDFTHDGRVDFVITRRGTLALVLYAQRADGSFVESTRVPSGGEWGSAAGDFNGDGYTDIASIAAPRVINTQLNRCSGSEPAVSRRRSVRH